MLLRRIRFLRSLNIESGVARCASAPPYGQFECLVGLISLEDAPSDRLGPSNTPDQHVISGKVRCRPLKHSKPLMTKDLFYQLYLR